MLKHRPISLNRAKYYIYVCGNTKRQYSEQIRGFSAINIVFCYCDFNIFRGANLYYYCCYYIAIKLWMTEIRDIVHINFKWIGAQFIQNRRRTFKKLQKALNDKKSVLLFPVLIFDLPTHRFSFLMLKTVIKQIDNKILLGLFFVGQKKMLVKERNRKNILTNWVE